MQKPSDQVKRPQQDAKDQDQSTGSELVKVHLHISINTFWTVKLFFFFFDSTTFSVSTFSSNDLKVGAFLWEENETTKD